MATPTRMVELACPRCGQPHWEIDSDYRGADLLGLPELTYEERTYGCPACGESAADYRVLQKGPTEFFLQPHSVYPMAIRDFARWLAVFRAHFPSDDLLGTAGVFWYPGEAGNEQYKRLSRAREIGTVEGYSLSLSNYGADDERIRVGVQNRGQAYFWFEPEVELDQCFDEFEPAELERMRALIVQCSSDIRRTWRTFAKLAREARAEWLPRLADPEGG